MADLTTAKDLKSQTLSQSGEVTDGTSDFDARSLIYINRAYETLQGGSNPLKLEVGDTWVWARARRPIAFNLDPKINTGTISLTNDSTSGTFSSAPTNSLVDRLIQVDSRVGLFRIQAHLAGGTAFTLDAKYDNDTGAALAYKAIKTDYRIKDFTSIRVRRLAGPMEVYRSKPEGSDVGDGKIEGIDPKTFLIEHPTKRVREQIPSDFTTINETDGEMTFRFNAYPKELTRVEFDYIPFHTPLRSS